MIQIDWTLINATNQTIQYINQTITNANNQLTFKTYLIWTWFILFTISLILFFIIRNKIKNNIELNKKTTKLQQEIYEEFKKLEKGEKVKEINISDLPIPIQKNILESESIISKMFYKTEKDKTKPPFLLLIRSDMTAEIKQNAKEGELILQKKDVNKTKVRLNLTSQKLINLKVGNKTRRIWIQFEDEAEPYPLQPKHHSKEVYLIILALQMLKRLPEAPKGKFPKIIIILGILAVIAGIIYFAFFYHKEAEVATIIKNNITNITHAVNMTSGQSQTIKI